MVGLEHRTFLRVLVVVWIALAWSPARSSAVGASPLKDGIVDPSIDRAFGPRPQLASPFPGPVSLNIAFAEGKRAEPVFYLQRLGARWVQIGLARDDAELRKAGWSALRWGFGLQRPDGSFDDAPGSVLGVASLLEGASLSRVAEQQFRVRTPGVVPLSRLALSATWLADLDPDRHRGVSYFRRYVHRNWTMAAAIALTGKLVKSERLLNAADRYARRGAKLQRTSGINPENNGYDVGYQATGIISAAHFFAACDDPYTRAITRRMIYRAAAWLATRVTVRGDVRPGKSTRVGVEDNLEGDTKRVPLEQIASGLAWAAQVTGEQRYATLAKRVLDRAAAVTTASAGA